jgi:hypothetical protein
MTSYFEGLDLDDAELIESFSRLTYVLRENRKLLLEQHDVEDELALLDKIATGDIAEHPGYEHYLSAKILADTREAMRAELGIILQGVKSA